jgi:hypothetical protein
VTPEPTTFARAPRPTASRDAGEAAGVADKTTEDDWRRGSAR